MIVYNWLIGDNKIIIENFLNKDNIYFVKKMNENWERVLKVMKEEFEKI